MNWFTKRLPGNLTPPNDRGWWPLIRESFTGAWQKNIAIQVEDIETVVEAMTRKGFRLGYITRHGIFDNGRAKVAYLEPEDTGGHLIELVELRS